MDKWQNILDNISTDLYSFVVLTFLVVQWLEKCIKLVCFDQKIIQFGGIGGLKKI